MIIPTNKSILWRSLVRVVDVDDFTGIYKRFYVIIPGWNVDERIPIYLQNVPKEIRDIIEVGKRFHVRVNLGASSADDLYFIDWEME